MSRDALVVGAGPAGLSAAITLAGRCHSVTVVEAGCRDRLRQVGEHIPPAGLAQIAAAGFDALLEDSRHGVSPGISSVWGDWQVTDNDYFKTVQGSGINLVRPILNQAMVSRAEGEGVSLHYSTNLRSMLRHAGGYSATLLGPHGRWRLDADLVVDASGRNAVAARQLGYGRTRCDRLIALAGQVTTCPEPDTIGRVYVEALADGWWYGVQLTEEVQLLIYMTDSEVLQSRSGGARALWRDRLRQIKLPALRACEAAWCPRISIFDAATQCLDASNDEPFLAVGDAAMAFDPVSSWGISKALCDGHYGAKALLRDTAGESGLAAAHAQQRLNAFHAYLAKRAAVYDAERRFQDSDFWRSRQTHASRPAA
jgi:flavin-dependent dehydrogenase